MVRARPLRGQVFVGPPASGHALLVVSRSSRHQASSAIVAEVRTGMPQSLASLSATVVTLGADDPFTGTVLADHLSTISLDELGEWEYNGDLGTATMAAVDAALAAALGLD